jgi:multidrug resistance efflux pump
MRPFCFGGAVGITAAAVVTAASVACLGCSTGRADDPASISRRAEGDDLTVQRGRFEDRFLITGTLAAVNADQLVVPRIPNWQTTIRWMEEEGSVVKAGQRVVEFDTSAFAQDFGDKKLAWEQAETDLEQAEADREAQLADASFQVAQKSIAVEKAKIAAAIPAEFLRGKDHQENQLALERAKAELDKAVESQKSRNAATAETILQKKIAVQKTRRDLDASALAMEGMTLAAPRNGILVVADHPWQGRKLQVGDSVWVGLPVVSLPDLSTMQVEAKLSDVDDGRIAPQLAVTCLLDAYPDRPFIGTIASITPIAQEEQGRSLRRAYNVRIQLDAPDAERMRPGMSVKVEVKPAAREDVLIAPRAGLDFTAAKPRARLASGKDVDVTLGSCNRDACVVESGLEAGARLRRAG